MSIEVMVEVWKESQHRGSALLLMLALADHASTDGYCWPGVNSLARKIRVTDKRWVQRLLHKLVESGELVVQEGGMGPASTNLYIITLGQDEPTLTKTIIYRLGWSPEQAERAAKESVALRKKGGDSDHPFPNKGGDLPT